MTTRPAQPNSTTYFDNLVVLENKKSQKIYVLRYKPTIEWNNSSKDFAEYSGKVSFYTIDGHELYSIKLNHGRIFKKESNISMKGRCDFTLKEVGTVCTNGGNLVGHENTTDWNCTTTYKFTWSCPTNSGGSWSSSGPGDSDSGSGYSDGGGSDNDDLDNFTTAPNHPNPVEEIIEIANNIDNPCGSLVFSQLQLQSMHYDLPPDVSNPDNVAEDIHFSDAILNIFNDSDEFDYIVEDDSNFLDSNTSASTDPIPVYNTKTMRFEITTRFNTSYLNKATRLSMARTMVHESVHAYLLFEQKNNYQGNIYQALSKYSVSNGYTLSGDILHHNFMAQFVNAMAYTLYRWDKNHGTGGNLGWQYYHDMAWGGLINYTDDHENIYFYDEYLDHTTQIQRDRIKSTVVDEANNTGSSSGGDKDCK